MGQHLSMLSSSLVEDHMPIGERPWPLLLALDERKRRSSGDMMQMRRPLLCSVGLPVPLFHLPLCPAILLHLPSSTYELLMVFCLIFEICLAPKFGSPGHCVSDSVRNVDGGTSLQQSLSTIKTRQILRPWHLSRI